MTLRRSITVGDVPIGPGEPCVFLADIGTFFNQDVAAGRELIDCVAAAGALFVKGEVLHDASICLDSDLLETITTRDAVVSKESYRDVIARKVLPLSAYESLFAHARGRRLRLALSVYDSAGLAFAQQQRAELVKIASSNIVHRPLIEQAAASGIATLMDTGASTLDEVARAVGWFTAAGGTQLIVEHSPAAPPAPVARHNLRRMLDFRDAFGCPVGLSDHHAGVEILFAAIALGASVVEKGVFPDSAVRDQDLAHGLAASALAETMRQCANVSAAMQPLPADAPTPQGHPARMGVIARHDMPAGHTLAAADLSYAFPALGVPVEHAHEITGRRLLDDVSRGAPIGWHNIERRDA